MKPRKITRTFLSPAAKERLIHKAALGNVRLADLEMEFGVSNATVRNLLKGAGVAVEGGWSIASDLDGSSDTDPRDEALAEFEVALQLLNEAASKLGLNPIQSP